MHFGVVSHPIAPPARASAERQLDAVLRVCPNAVLLVDADGRIAHANRAAEALFGETALELEGSAIWDWIDPGPERDRLRSGVESGRRESEPPCRVQLAGARQTVVDARAEPLTGDGGGAVLLFGASSDFEKMTDQLHRSHHLEAIGRLSSGIAHEINTPIQFVGNSATFLESAVSDMGRLVAAYRDLVSAAAFGPVHPSVIREVRFLEQDIDLDYLLTRIPEAIGRINHGVERVAEIVQAVRTFAHRERLPKQAADLNRALESALLLVKSSVRRVARLVIDVPALPPVVCHESDISQVFLNLLVNAVDAVAQSGKTAAAGLIEVRATAEQDMVVVTVSDNGCGVPEAVRERVFESFFTTKGPGEGTGQGLAIARHTVETIHGGRLTFETATGIGTTFRVELPVDDGPIRACS